MARKSGWQQFADNFTAVYGEVNKFGREGADRDIMDQKAVEQFDEAGASTGFSMGGKNYGTLEDTRQAKYQGLSDNAARYGDVKGAMDMQFRSEEIGEKRRANKLKDATFAADSMGPFNQNLLTLSNVGLNDAGRDQKMQQTARMIQLLPFELQGKALENAEKVLGNEAQIIKNYIQNASKDDQADSFGLKNNLTRSQVDLNASNATRNRALTKTTDLKNEFTRETQPGAIDYEQSKNKTGISSNNVTMASNKKEMATHEAWANWASDVTSGLYPNEEAKVTGFLEYMSGVDPVGAAELRKKYNVNTLSFITDETMRYQAELKKGMAKGGIDGVMSFIDKDNGNDLNVEIKKTDNGLELVETYTTGDDKGKVKRVIATGADKKALGLAAMQEASPDKLLPFMAEQTDINYKKAVTEYTLAKSKSEGLGKGLTKDQWAIARFTKNPKDPLAAAILMGDGYSMDDIETMVKHGNLTGKMNDAEGNAGGSTDKPAPVTTVDNSPAVAEGNSNAMAGGLNDNSSAVNRYIKKRAKNNTSPTYVTDNSGRIVKVDPAEAEGKLLGSVKTIDSEIASINEAVVKLSKVKGLSAGGKARNEIQKLRKKIVGLEARKAKILSNNKVVNTGTDK